MAVDEDKLNAFLGKALGDLGAAMSAVLILVGDELGLYSALAEGRLTSGELAERTGTSERYVREWLANQAAGGYVEYDSDSEKYYLSEAQALCLANPNGPMDLPGGYSVVEDLFHVKDRAIQNFRTGSGMEWESTIRACSRAPNASSGPGTTRTCCPRGCPRSTAWWKSFNRVVVSPTSAAAMGSRQF